MADKKKLFTRLARLTVSIQRCGHTKTFKSDGNIINCRDLTESINKSVESQISQRKSLNKLPVPALSIIYDEDNFQSQTRTTQIKNHCETLGIETSLHKLPTESATYKQFRDLLVKMKLDPHVDGCLITSPIFNRYELISALDDMALKKDIDAISVEYQDRKNLVNFPHFPCKVSAALEVLRRCNVSVHRKTVLLHGHTRNLTFLKYIFMSLVSKEEPYVGGTTVIETHGDTAAKNLKNLALKADIIVTEAGMPTSITADMVKPGSYVLDLSQNEVVKDGRSNIVGDVDLEQVKNKAAGVTPVLGGINHLADAMIGVHTLAVSMRKFQAW